MRSEVQVRAVRDNLLLAVAFWSAARHGKIRAASINVGVPGDSVSAMLQDRLKVSRDEDLLRGSVNQIRGAFGFSIMQVNRTMEEVFGKFPLQEADTDLRDARCIVYLLDRAMANDLLEPTWSCPPDYRRKFDVQAARFSLDASVLEGRKLSWDDFGGLDKYLDLLEYCISQVERALELRPLQADGPEPQAASGRRNSSEDSTNHAGGIPAFLDSRCLIDPSAYVMAKDLYDSYVKWCQDVGAPSLLQRSFGMRLTECGFKRKRRGRGRHWWQGIALAPTA